MSRPKSVLNPTYGKLTVLGELPGSKVSVRCQCGTEKAVLRNNLRSGRVLSCGGAGCRESTYTGPGGERLSGPRPFGPSWCRREDIPAIWSRYKDAKDLVVDIAADYGVSGQSVYALFRKIDALGGIEPYMLRLRHERGEEAPAPAPATIPTLHPSPTPPPRPTRVVEAPAVPKPVPGQVMPPPAKGVC